MSKAIIYTIGHSTHSLDYFLELLRSHAITALIDVRSIAASKHCPQFNSRPFADFLNRNGIHYLHFATEFGARQTDPGLLDEEGKVDFAKARNSPPFKEGVRRLAQGVDKGFTIALMCAESDPLACHRFSMISMALAANGFEVNHILKDGTLKTNQQLERELLFQFAKAIPQPTIFQPCVPRDEQLTVAYRLKNKEIAFAPH